MEPKEAIGQSLIETQSDMGCTQPPPSSPPASNRNKLFLCIFSQVCNESQVRVGPRQGLWTDTEFMLVELDDNSTLGDGFRNLSIINIQELAEGEQSLDMSSHYPCNY